MIPMSKGLGLRQMIQYLGFSLIIKEGNEWKQRKMSLDPFWLIHCDSTDLTATIARTKMKLI
jgi:hypothetical protein